MVNFLRDLYLCIFLFFLCFVCIIVLPQWFDVFYCLILILLLIIKIWKNIQVLIWIKVFVIRAPKSQSESTDLRYVKFQSNDSWNRSDVLSCIQNRPPIPSNRALFEGAAIFSGVQSSHTFEVNVMNYLSVYIVISGVKISCSHNLVVAGYWTCP